MEFKASFLLLSLACACACICVAAYPDPLAYALEDEPNLVYMEPLEFFPDAIDVEMDHPRVRRQWQLQGGGGGGPRQGIDLSLSGRAPVWQSQNGRHSVDATGQYAQHLGGPYGNSRPQFGVGGQYTFRF
ncbi:diptericin-A [Drosophila subobscura]|uniref:diptericin-A n=1 Tax=Drosophila subobscura TaxID=7241 RepID=UPI00155A44D4|nr:diptericin-A [Drosophila subobscura]